MTHADLFVALRHRWRTVLAYTLVVLVAAAVWTLITPRVYSGAASLLFDATTDETNPGDQRAEPLNPTLLGTQADVIRSVLVADQVARDLRLDEQPEWRRRWRLATDGKGDIHAWIIRQLRQNVSAVPTRNTNVLLLTYLSSDPQEAARIANGFARAFVAIQLKLRTDPARVYSNWFAARTRDVKGRYEAAQARLTQFQQQQGLIGGEKLDVELGHLTGLSSELATAEGAAADSQGKARAASASPEVQFSPAVVSLRAAVAAKTAEVQQLSATMGPNHPSLMTARAALASLNAKLGEALGAATRSLSAASASANAREQDLRGRVATQRAHVLQLQGKQDRLAVLQRDVDAAKLAYDMVVQRLNSMRLKAAIPRTDVTILDRASPSYFPVSPDIPLRLVLSLLLGLMIGAGLVGVEEWLAPRVRTAGGLARALGLDALVDVDDYRRTRERLFVGARA